MDNENAERNITCVRLLYDFKSKFNYVYNEYEDYIFLNIALKKLDEINDILQLFDFFNKEKVRIDNVIKSIINNSENQEIYSINNDLIDEYLYKEFNESFD